MKDEILSTGDSIYSEIAKVRQQLDAALKGIREEFDEHRDSINDNTNEVQANYEYLCRIDAKIEKLAERMDELQMKLSTIIPMPAFEEEQNARIELSEKEKEVFMIMYASEEKALTYRDVARIMDESDFLVSGYITNLIEKGIPIIKKYMGHTAYLLLDKRFRDLQAKNNVLNINQTTVKQFF